MQDGRDHWYHDLMATADADCPAEPMDSEQLLFLLYTSGAPPRHQGHHAHERRLPPRVAFTHKYVRSARRRRVLVHRRRRVDHRPQLHRVRLVANGATQVMYEGVPNFTAGNDRFWAIIAKRRDEFYGTDASGPS
ncbi:MAG: hypothetical protein R2713_07065 [Ilumatobacteraceae bacterium]